MFNAPLSWRHFPEQLELKDVTSTARAADHFALIKMEPYLVPHYLHPTVDEDNGVYFVGYVLDELFLAIAELRPATIFSFGTWLGLVLDLDVRQRRSGRPVTLRLCFLLGPCESSPLQVKIWRAYQPEEDSEELPF
jgi:hypothetical protein